VQSRAEQSGPIYEPRHPGFTVLHQVVSQNLETFVELARARGHPLPLFVEQTFRDYLACGDPTAGFVRFRCQRCRFERIVAFSCKRRGFCPSCGGRRMADTAANLVDFVLPEVGIRQYVLSLPFWLRHRLAYDSALLTPVVQAFVAAVFASVRKRAKRKLGVRRGQCGAVTFVQRFGGALNLNVHFHTLVLEGVYETPARAQQVQFHPLPAPSLEQIQECLADAARRIERVVAKGGVGSEDDENGDPMLKTNLSMAEIYAGAVQSVVPLGTDKGRPTRRVRKEPRTAPASRKQSKDGLCAVGEGLSLHAGVFVPARDRSRLEHVCRYVARPALASDRLTLMEDGSIDYRLSRPWNDGTTTVVLGPLELLARLAALVPPPRSHQVRYHGVLAPNAAWRDQVVPAVKVEAAAGKHSHRRHDGQPARPVRIPWADLLRRVFAVDVLVCPRCAGRMHVLTGRDAIGSVLAAVRRSSPLQRSPPARCATG